jgi:deoxyribonuclease V
MSKITHSWGLSPPEAIALQGKLRQKVVLFDQFAPPERIAGVDVGFEQRGEVTRAAIAVLDFPGLKPIEEAVARVPTRFPYIPGLLSFREIPAILKAFEKLKQKPELLLCDGQGYAHPRRFGLASHLGLLLDIPSIGVAKSRLIGQHDELPSEKGAWVPLIDKGETIGAVLRTRTKVNPLYISTGHRVSLQSAINYVLAATTRYKLPETTRAAHRLASG